MKCGFQKLCCTPPGPCSPPSPPPVVVETTGREFPLGRELLDGCDLLLLRKSDPQSPTSRIINNDVWQKCLAKYKQTIFEITIENLGIDTISNIPVYYSLNGGTPVSVIVTGTLNPGQTTNYTFVPSLSLTTGLYTLNVWTDYTGDQNTFNDTITTNFTYNSSLITLPYTQDFESEALCNTSSAYNHMSIDEIDVHLVIAKFVTTLKRSQK